MFKKIVISMVILFCFVNSSFANFPVDPEISEIKINRISDTQAVVLWKTSYNITGGVIQYSKKHEFAKGLDPFSLKIKLEKSESCMEHKYMIEDIDSSIEWRFRVSYQLGEKFKYDSPIIYPFAKKVEKKVKNEIVEKKKKSEKSK